MQLNQTTMNVLKNFSTINDNLVVSAGNVVKSMGESRNIMAKATLDQEFPSGFGIYDLGEFLNVVSLVDSPTLGFTEDFATISDGSGRSRVKYFFSDPDILTSPTSDVKVSDCEVSFTLNNDTLNQLKRAGAALGHNSLSIRPDGKSLKLSIFAEDNPTGNTYDTVIAGTFPEGAQFDLILNIQHLKMIAGDYEVEVSSKGVAHLTHDAECKMEYWIALEKSSKWEG